MHLSKDSVLKILIGIGLFAIIVSLYIQYITPYIQERAIEKDDQIRIADMSMLESFLSNAQSQQIIKTVDIQNTDSMFTETLEFGSRGDEVRALQKLLEVEDLYPTGLITGYMGEQTVTALKKFQEKYHIAQTDDDDYGIFGPQTRKQANRLSDTQTTISSGTGNTVVYVSIPAADRNCADLDLPSLSDGWSYRCADKTTYQKIDGTGWIPVDFTTLSNKSSLTLLPVDPINSVDTLYYYTYSEKNGFVATALLGSQKFRKEFARGDGGIDPNRFETGSQIELWEQAFGFIGFWEFKKNFNGADDYDIIQIPGLPASTSEITIEFWAKPVEAEMASILNASPDDVANRLNISLPWSGNTIIWDYGNVSAGGRLISKFETAWYNKMAHWVFVSGENGMKIYRNGVSIGSGKDHSSFKKGDRIFYTGYGLSFWKGYIDEIAMYNRALGSREIQLLYGVRRSK